MYCNLDEKEWEQFLTGTHANLSIKKTGQDISMLTNNMIFKCVNNYYKIPLSDPKKNLKHSNTALQCHLCKKLRHTRSRCIPMWAMPFVQSKYHIFFSNRSDEVTNMDMINNPSSWQEHWLWGTLIFWSLSIGQGGSDKLFSMLKNRVGLARRRWLTLPQNW